MIRDSLSNDENIFALQHKLGAKVKATDEIKTEVFNLTCSNRRMSDKHVADIISENDNFPKISRSLINNIRHEVGFNYLPPIHTFLTTEIQRENRVKFCQYHIDNNTSWENVIFTDESIFELNSQNRWIWRRRGEKSDNIYNATNKYNKKVMVFAGISKKFTTPLIAIIKGTIDADSYVDDCIDQSGLIPGMNDAYGHFGWVLMQDGASPHTAASTIEYLKDYCHILDDWPSNSPDLNPIENLWSILKMKIDELNPQSEDKLCDILFNIWDNLDVSLIHRLIDSVPSRLHEVIKSQGYPTKY